MSNTVTKLNRKTRTKKRLLQASISVTFSKHGVVKDVRTIFMNKKEYVYIPEVSNPNKQT